MNSTAMTLPTSTPTAAEARPSERRIAPTVVRLLYGLAFTVFGLNGFLNFLPQPSTPPAPGAMAFAGALVATGYMMPLIATTQLVSGVLLLLNRFVPLALLFLAPFLVNSVLFHLKLEHSGLPMAAVFAALEVYLLWVYRAAFRPVLTARTSL